MKPAICLLVALLLQLGFARGAELPNILWIVAEDINPSSAATATPTP